MKIIIDGGLSSKNSPIYTLDSFMLANINKKIDGINIEVHLTKDNKIVLINNKLMKKLNINQTYINNTSLSKIKNLNIGNRVKQHKIISIDELLEIFNKKYIFVTLIQNQDINKNILLVDLLLKRIKNYKNIYWFLSSSSANILNLISSINPNIKTIKILNNKYKRNYYPNFYIMDINNQISVNSNIFFYIINTKNEYRLLNKLSTSFKDLFIIINNYNLINNT